MPDYDFWNQRWTSGQIGFHQNSPHPSLIEFSKLLAPYQSVFVPLCGKSLDMIYLREQGHWVVGVEFSEIAVREFIAENQLSLTQTQLPKFKCFEGEGLKIYQGDLFDLTPADLAGVSACYDRASMVAFNFEERLRYSQFLKKTAIDMQVILSPLLDYGHIVESAPPFSVTSDELQKFYGDQFELVSLKDHQCELRETLKARGALYEKEVTWFMKKKN